MIEHLAINTPYFGILLSLIPFIIATFLFKKTNGFFLFTPLFVSMVVGIAFLKLTGIDYANYKIGGDIINFFLEPATICFAIPLYKRRDVLKKYWKQILGGITLGTTVMIYALGSKLIKLFNITNPIARGLALGTSGHSLGVSSAQEFGETEASMASISLVIVGVIVVIVAPILATLLL